MFDTAVTSGGREVISSGSVVSFSGAPVEIRVTQNKSEFLTLVFVFRTAKEVGARPCPRMESRAIGPQKLEIVLTGFDHPAGCGTGKPMAVASNGTHRVLLHFRIHALPDADRTVVYTLYLEGKQPLGGPLLTGRPEGTIRITACLFGALFGLGPRYLRL